jgi:hypothetical protein
MAQKKRFYGYTQKSELLCIAKIKKGNTKLYIKSQYVRN